MTTNKPNTDSQQYIDRFRQTAAADAVQSMATRWLIVNGDEYTFVRARDLNLTVQVIAPDTEHPIEIQIRIVSEMMELDHDRTVFGFTGSFDNRGENGIWGYTPCIGFYDAENRRGELTVFKY